MASRAAKSAPSLSWREREATRWLTAATASRGKLVVGKRLNRFIQWWRKSMKGLSCLFL
jgi:hypothetical protein